MLARQQMFPLPVPSQRNHMGMLAENQHIFDQTGFSRGYHTFLQLPGLRVAYQSKIDLQEDLFHLLR
jgi:hypothetical protein